MMKPVIIVIPTTAKTHEEFAKKEIYDSLSKLYQHYKHVPNASLTFYIVKDNKDGLSKVYNKFLTEDYKKYILVFCHDDLIINSIDFVEQLNDAMKQFDIVGLAGSSEFKKGDTAWHTHQISWRDTSVLSGSVGHMIRGKYNLSFYGQVPKRCIVMDGLFLAVNTEKAIETEWKFNENFDWNFYDLASCLDANEKKMKMGTWNIPVVHYSDGGGPNGYGSEVWQKDAQKFLELYNK